jgi:hypothetical protein
VSEEWRGFNPRQEDRYQVHMPGVACRQDGSRVQVRVDNVSREGCQLTSAEDFTIGEIIELELSGRSYLRAQVRWSLAGKAGIRFIDPLH